MSYFADDVSFPCFASLKLGQHLEDNYETVDLKYLPTNNTMANTAVFKTWPILRLGNQLSQLLQVGSFRKVHNICYNDFYK